MAAAAGSDYFTGADPPVTFTFPDVSSIPCRDTSPDPFRPTPDAARADSVGNCNPVGTRTNEYRLEAAAKTLGFLNDDERDVSKGIARAKQEVAAFVRNGGQYYVTPMLNETVVNSDGFITPVIEDGGFAIHLAPGDVVIPVCHEGMNRSQILYLALHALKKRCNVEPLTIGRPHGAESGFDPYAAYADLDGENVYGYINGVMLPRGSPGEWLHECFFKTFKAEKSLRVGDAGDADAGLNPVESDSYAEMFRRLSRRRRQQRQLMSQLLFSPNNLRARLTDQARNKVIFFCFCRAASIVLRRIYEQGQSCENICIVALPWADNISRAGGRDEIELIARASGVEVDRDTISIWRHEHVFQMYSSFLRVLGGEGSVSRTLGGGAIRVFIRGLLNLHPSAFAGLIADLETAEQATVPCTFDESVLAARLTLLPPAVRHLYNKATEHMLGVGGLLKNCIDAAVLNYITKNQVHIQLPFTFATGEAPGTLDYYYLDGQTARNIINYAEQVLSRDVELRGISKHVLEAPLTHAIARGIVVQVLVPIRNLIGELTEYELAYEAVLQMFYGPTGDVTPLQDRIITGLYALKKLIKTGTGTVKLPVQPTCAPPDLTDDVLRAAYARVMEACRMFPPSLHAYAVNYVNCVFNV